MQRTEIMFTLAVIFAINRQRERDREREREREREEERKTLGFVCLCLCHLGRACLEFKSPTRNSALAFVYQRLGKSSKHNRVCVIHKLCFYTDTQIRPQRVSQRDSPHTHTHTHTHTDT